MSSNRDTTSIVRSWLEEGVTTLPDRVLDGVLDQLPATRQRRSLWRWSTIGNFGAQTRLAMAAAAVVIAILGLELVPAIFPSIGGTPSPSPTTSPTASPTPTELPSPTVQATLGTRRESLQSFAVPGITVEVPGGWSLCGDSPDEASLCSDNELGVAFLIVQNLAAGSCKSAFDLQSPPVGPSVDDLVAGLSSLSGVTATQAVDISIDGFEGKELIISSAVPPICAVYTWSANGHTNGMATDEANLVRVFDVRGTRLVIAGSYPRIGSDAGTGAALVREIMDSVHIAP